MKPVALERLKVLADISVNADVPVPDQYKNGTPYYAFLYMLGQTFDPELIVELGTGREARSAAHFAAGAPGAKVVGIDFEPPNFLPYPNIEWIKGDTLNMNQILRFNVNSIDLLFIDSTHESNHALVEFENYWPIVKPGGVVLCDDINLGDMRLFWDRIAEEKFEHSELHGDCGFGVILKGE